MSKSENVPSESNPPSKRLLFIVIGGICLLSIAVGIYFAIEPKIQKDTTTSTTSKQESKDSKTKVMPAGPKAETKTAEYESISDLIKGREKIDIDVSSNSLGDNMYLQNIQSANIDRPQSFRIIPPVYAQDTPASIQVPKIIFQQISDNAAMEIAKKFGFDSAPTKPDQDPRFLRWEDENRRLIINTYTIDYEEYNAGQSSPSVEDSKKIAVDYLRSIGYLPAEYDIYGNPDNTTETYTFSESSDEGHPHRQSFVKSTEIDFVTKYNSLPISRGDISARFYGNEINAFPNTYVWVGPDSKIVSLAIAKNLTPVESGIQLPLKTQEEALKDLESTGGVFMNSEYLEQQQGNSYCYLKKCGVKDAVIDTAKLVYYQSDSLPRNYNDDEQPVEVGYMIPMWLFGGEGTMVRTVDGQSTYDTRVRFISSVYAVHSESNTQLFTIPSLESQDRDGDNWTINFNIGFNVPPYQGVIPNPRQGIDYTVLVLYPDNTYGEYRGVIYEPDSREELVIPTNNAQSPVKVILYLTDFPAIMKQIELQ